MKLILLASEITMMVFDSVQDVCKKAFNGTIFGLTVGVCHSAEVIWY